MKRGESVAVIYLSLLVCLALGQSTEGRGYSQSYTCSYVCRGGGTGGHWGGICLPWNISSLTSFTCNQLG